MLEGKVGGVMISHSGVTFGCSNLENLDWIQNDGQMVNLKIDFNRQHKDKHNNIIHALTCIDQKTLHVQWKMKADRV